MLMFHPTPLPLSSDVSMGEVFPPYRVNEFVLPAYLVCFETTEPLENESGSLLTHVQQEAVLQPFHTC